MTKFRIGAVIAGGLLPLLMAATPPLHELNDRPQGPAQSQAQPKWMLNSFLQLSANDAPRLLAIGDKLFSADRLRISSIEPTLAFEWQHRLAMVSALSDFFTPNSRRSRAVNIRIRNHARHLIALALRNDPSLLVRDGSVESVRRILRMQPAERKVWHKTLESAFLDPKNFPQGEGLFIRETILTALREASLDLSPLVRRSAEKDKNTQVRALLKSWRTQAYDNL